MDREKVIKAWECCNPFNRKCNECPYEKDCYHDGISRHMVADAIAMLKEQENDIHHMSLIIDEFEKEKQRNPVIVCPHCGKRVK
jgi:hypothetical protein